MTLIHADCLDAMAAMEPESVDAIVTDPPYDLTGHRWVSMPDRPEGHRFARSQHRTAPTGGFMGKAWDGTGVAFRPETWAAAIRVAKPGSYLLAFGGTRTVHRLASAIEDAGWIIRDMLVWAYASGFPKSKSSLKPAWEPIVMARKPGPLRELAIDACRIAHADAADLAESLSRNPGRNGETVTTAVYGGNRPQQIVNTAGRWPSNILLTDPIFDGDMPGVVGGGEQITNAPGPSSSRNRATLAYGGGWTGDHVPFAYDTEGTYSRFFLVPKADRADREPILGGLPQRRRTMNSGLTGVSGDRSDRGGRAEPLEMGAAERANHHPTVKPTELMRHLVRLVTPAGGTVLDPFLGSGTTALAAEMEGFAWIGIEKEAEYIAIAEARLNGTQRGLGLGA